MIVHCMYIYYHYYRCQAAYLQKAGQKVCVLERRHLIGGAAVTEEIIPGINVF